MAFTRPKAAQIDFDITNITDPLIRLNSGQSGANDKDVGIVIERGDDTNTAFLYDESADQFVLVNTTETGTTSGNVTIASYAGLQADAIVYGSLNDGTTTLTATVAELNTLDGITATVAELNTLDGITATVTELNYTDGVTSNIQTQLDAKAPTATPTFTGNATFDTNTLFVDASNNRIGVGTTSPAYQVEIENTGANALLVLDRTDGAACFIEGQATRSAFGSVGATPLALAYNSFAVVTIGANGAITVNPDGDGFTFPTTDGTSGQTLVTDGAGTLSFTTLNQTISLAGDTGTDTYTTGQTLTFAGGSGISTTVTDNTVTINTSGAAPDIELDSATGDNTTTDFTVTTAPTAAEDLLVTINGLVQRPTTDYTVSGTTVTFTTAPFTGAVVAARTITAASTGPELSADTTPQLGGNLDLNSNDITGTGNVNITGNITSSGDLTVDTNTLYVDSTNNRVGIVNASPTTALDVTGDITVSGGVYLGGTGSANYLDDYEEGTWTPTPQTNSGTAASIGTSSGIYTKVGRLITIIGVATNITPGDTSTSIFRIGGLPFTPANENSTGSAVWDSITFQGASTRFYLAPQARQAGYIQFIQAGENNASTALDHGDLDAGNTSDIEFTVTYMV